MTDRGITTPLNYVLLLGIVGILISGLILGMGGLVSDRQTEGVRAGLATTAERMATDVSTVGRLADGADRASLRSSLPTKVVGTQYVAVVEALDGDRYRLRLTSDDPEVTVVTTFASPVPVRETRVPGGELAISYDPDANEVVIGRA